MYFVCGRHRHRLPLPGQRPAEGLVCPGAVPLQALEMGKGRADLQGHRHSGLEGQGTGHEQSLPGYGPERGGRTAYGGKHLAAHPGVLRGGVRAFCADDRIAVRAADLARPLGLGGLRAVHPGQFPLYAHPAL